MEPHRHSVRHNDMRSHNDMRNNHTTSADTAAAVTPHRALLVLLAVIALTGVYLVGATRSGGLAPAAASTGTTTTSSAQPSTIGGVGGPGITVSGTAAVAGTPDTLRVDLSVVATATSVTEALAKANGAADAVQKSLLGSGVTKKDLQTSGLNIGPRYDYTNPAAPRLTGFDVSESLTAKLRDLGRAGDAIGKAVGAGGNAVRVNGVSLNLEETGALVSEARGAAFADARTKAEQYARAAGRSLGGVVSVAESVANPSPISMGGADVLTTAAKVPIQPGSQNVSVTVSVVFSMS
jgi:uncharacterized protein YggE